MKYEEQFSNWEWGSSYNTWMSTWKAGTCVVPLSIFIYPTLSRFFQVSRSLRAGHINPLEITTSHIPYRAL